MFDHDKPSRDVLPLVVVIDDDALMREALRDLFESAGLRVNVLNSAPEMADMAEIASANCLVLDIRLPRSSGFVVQQQLKRAGIRTPVIFISGHADIPVSVRAMKAGAIDFLPKPFREQDMLDAVLAAISDDRGRKLAEQRYANLKARFEQLSIREREVMALVTKGLLNKQVAGHLGFSEVTIKVYRRQVMDKMGVHTLADLVRCAEALGLNTFEAGERREPVRQLVRRSA